MPKSWFAVNRTKVDNAGIRHLGAIKTKTEAQPQRVCYVCGLREWWYREGSLDKKGWLCGRYHPELGSK